MFVSTHTRFVTAEGGKMPRPSGSAFPTAGVTALPPIGGSEDGQRETFARRFPHQSADAHKGDKDAELAKAEAARQFEAAAALSVTLTSLALSTRTPVDRSAEPWNRRGSSADDASHRIGEPSLDDLLAQALATPHVPSPAGIDPSQSLD